MKKVVIIGAGISGLSLAFLLKDKYQVQILEKSTRSGGKIKTELIDGYLLEHGPNGMIHKTNYQIDDLRKAALSAKLCNSLNLKMLSSNQQARIRFIYTQGKLQRLPQTIKEFITTKLLTINAKLRILGELLISRTNLKQDDVSLAYFSKRRFGIEVYNKIISPMVKGIYGSNAEQISLKSSFSQIYHLEQKYGSVLKAFLKLKLFKKNNELVLNSFTHGMQVLIDNLVKRIDPSNIFYNQIIDHISLQQNQYQISSNNKIHYCDILIIATPAYAAATILQSLAPSSAKLLKQIIYLPLIVVFCAYDAKDITLSLNGYGYLVADAEPIPLLGTLWESSIFISRTTDGTILLRSILGGNINPELIKLNDQQLISMVKTALTQTMQITAIAKFTKVIRHPRAIPQYNVSHQKKINNIEQSLAHYKNLYLAGNAYYGVGINDCILRSYELSNTIHRLYDSN